MADVRPFRAWRYNPERVDDLGAVLAPPYDVISPDEQRCLYDRSPYNVVRVELTRAEPSDPPGTDGEAARHARAREALLAWVAAGVLRQDPRPSLYLYQQQYERGGSPRALRSLLAVVRLAPWSAGEVLRHEHTLSGPRAERLGLLRATATNISPIWSLYEDPAGAATAALEPGWASPPVAEATDASGIHHALRAVDDPSRVAAARAAFADLPLYIADGHHRYETALAYQAEARTRAATSEHGADYVLMLLTRADDPGLQVLATHRVFHGLPDDRRRALPRLLERSFHLADLPYPEDPRQLPALLDAHLLTDQGAPIGRRFILLGPEPERLRLLALTDESVPAAAPLPALAALDVWIAHEALLGRMLGIGAAELARQDHLTYTRDPIEAATAVRSGRGQLALFLAHTPVEQLLSVARAGGVMPQKSTYFYPKPATGLVIRRVE